MMASVALQDSIGWQEQIQIQERIVPVNIKSGRRVNYHTMIVLALIAGGFGIAVQFMPDGEILAFMVSAAALGGLIGGSNDYNEQDRQQLRQSYKIAYEWLLLAIMTAYAFIMFSRWLSILEGVAIFLNSHWPSLVISMMCLLMGLAGFQRTRSESSA
jgi:hypothetical protein